MCAQVCFLDFLVRSIGFNALTNILKQVSEGKVISDHDILLNLQKAIEETQIEQKLTNHEIQTQLARIFRKFDVLKNSLNSNDVTILKRLAEQSYSYETFQNE